MNGESGDSRAGWAVASGDFTGDGKADVAVSAIGASPGGKDASGTTYVVEGKTCSDAVKLGALGADGFRIDGDDGDQSGWSLASGDVDGDRKPELVIGVPFHNPDGSLMAGSAYVLKGGALSGNMSLANPRRRRLPHRRRQDPGRRGLGGRDLARPQRRRPRRGPARRPGRGPPVRARRWRPPRTAWARRSRSAPPTWCTAPRPRRTSRQHADRQGPAADGRRRLPVGRPGRLERRGPRRHRATPASTSPPSASRAGTPTSRPPSAPAATAASRCCSTASRTRSRRRSRSPRRSTARGSRWARRSTWRSPATTTRPSSPARRPTAATRSPTARRCRRRATRSARTP